MERQDYHASAPPLDALHARRAAAARRRALLSITLVAITAGLAAASFFVAVPWWGAVIPGVLLIGVLVLGRRAVVAGARADASRAAQASNGSQPGTMRHPVPAVTRPGRPAPAVRPPVTGRAKRPSQSHTRMIARLDTSDRPAAKPVGTKITSAEATVDEARPADVEDQQASAKAPVRPEAAVATERASKAPDVKVSQRTPQPEGAEWQPVAVPRPVYVTKSAAPRWEPAPLTAALRQLTAERQAVLVEAFGGGTPYEPLVEAPDDSLGVNLNSVLARRRVAGE